MILGEGTSQFEIVVAEVEAPTPQSSGGDVRVDIRVRFGDFSGVADAWILREVWHGFIESLRTLERRRQGEAAVRSISPGELSLRVFSLDRAGHMAVEGEVGTLHYQREASLRFAPIAFDQSRLPELVNELTTASARA